MGKLSTKSILRRQLFNNIDSNNKETNGNKLFKKDIKDTFLEVSYEKLVSDTPAKIPLVISLALQGAVATSSMSKSKYLYIQLQCMRKQRVCLNIYINVNVYLKNLKSLKLYNLINFC